MAWRLYSELDEWARKDKKLRGRHKPGARSYYPAHLEVGNLHCHHWRGEDQVGRHVRCLACNVTSNTRNRNGDARFIRAHRKCAPTR